MLALVGAALLATALVRVPLLTRQGLWVDEVFSLAVASGHSLEHPAAEAEPARGDFVVGVGARRAEDWRAYLEPDEPPAGLARVVRAVQLSDTSPPLYYLALSTWMRALGASDASLRGFSLVCALACVPFLARLARWRGRRAVVPALFLYALTPLSIYYGTEGRMYALLWTWIVGASWCTVWVRARGTRGAWLSWSALAAAGLLTHYFFAFVWASLVLFLWLRPGRASRRALIGATGLAVLAVLPWYAGLGLGLGRWRVTQDWLTETPAGFWRPAAALELFLGLFSGGAPLQWGEHRLARAATLALFALLAGVLVRRAGARPRASTLLALLGLLAGWGGPLVFDALRGTYTVGIARYALPAFPAAVLLAASAHARLGPAGRYAHLGALLLAWSPHFELQWRRYSRSWCPLREVANLVAERTDSRSLVIVHSIPSGVLGFARYYDGPAELRAWVPQLADSLPSAPAELAPGKDRIVLVRVHEVGAACPLEGWLRSEAVLESEAQREGATLLTFRLARPAGA
jgi:hypothetical protein